jgi:autonomous glycyl radical cofactor GrcA
MDNVVDLEEYLKLKEKKILTVFIFLLDDEYPHLEMNTSWLHYVKEQVYLVRLSEDEFRMLDIGVHPKIIVFHGGKELKEYNGIIPIKTFRAEMLKLKKRIS